MNSSDWKCPSCGYCNQALDDRCASCSLEQDAPSNQPATTTARRPGDWKRKLYGCLFLILVILAGYSWLSLTATGQAFVVERMRRLVANHEVVQARREWEGSAEYSAAKKSIQEDGREINRLLDVLQHSQDEEISAVALDQLQERLLAYTASYLKVHGFHPEMPQPIAAFQNFAFEFVEQDPLAKMSPRLIVCASMTFSDWTLEDVRQREPLLLRLLSLPVAQVPNRTEHFKYGGDYEEMHRLNSQYEEMLLNREQQLEISSTIVSLLEEGLYPSRFVQRDMFTGEAELPDDFDIDYAHELLPKLQATANKSQSPPVEEMITRIADELHRVEVLRKVAGN